MEKDYISIISKRGITIDKTYMNNLIEFEKFCRKNEIKNIDTREFFNEFENKFNLDEKIFIELFKKNSNNTNYIDYLVIIKTLNTVQLKNLYRFFIIQWYIFKKKNYLEISNSQDMNYIQNIDFRSYLSLSKLTHYDLVFKQFIFNIKEFIEQDKKIDKGFNTHFHFIINNICEYLNLK